MTLRITIEIGEREYFDDGELFHADIKKRIEFERFTPNILEGFESEPINMVRKALKEIKQMVKK